ncbi:MAG: SusE domain-containing protein [Bacteroidales bacterium]|nr:SusE domain-containing protein [Bacteroidales bacterium]
MKITRYFAMLAAVAGLSVACQEELEHVVYNPENVVAPVLHAVEDIVVTVDNKSDNVTFTWDAADFGVKTQVYYTLDMARGDKKVSLFSGVSGTSMNVSYDNINNKAFNDLAIPSGDAADVTFTLGASLGVGETFYASPVSAKVTPTAAEKVYPKLTVAGSYAYNSWSPGKGQYVYDFDETDVKYSGVIDFGEDVSALEFKFVGTAWGENEFSAPEGAEQTAEASELTLVAGGGSNISAYRHHRFYSLTLDKSTPKVIKNFSFNQIGVIGSFNGWADDVVMQFNAEKQRFYADVEFTEAGQFKLRADADWSVNWGADAFGVTVSNGDGNLEAAAGQYRIYADMNNPAGMTIELVEGMYGKDEPVGGTTEPEPEPEPVKGWGLVGEYNGWGATPDVMLASDGTYLAAKGVELSGQVKFRKDGGWDVNFGAPGDVEPVEITVNTELTLAAGGKNFTIAAGTYDVYLDEANAKAWFINDGSYPGGGAAPVASEWGLIGSIAACNNWSVNIPLYVDGDYSVAKGVVFAANDQFKFRKGEAWGVELTYEGAITIDAKLDLIDGTGGKQNSSIAEAGTYDVYLANDLSAYYVMTPGKTPADAGEAQKTYVDPSAETFVVGFSGSALGWDDPSFDTNDRASFVSKNVTDAATYAGTYEFKLEGLAIAENDELKVRINGQWIGVGGATVEGLAVTGTDNFIAGEAGTYTAVITFAWDGSTHSDVKVVFSK